ncbi:hypothetical protein [Occallatibacter riparius]|uniref:IPT/TIG domain-containing protein n=1 Tax=Occallatibacter riparius TaxID=1002689 RepID=A0A9J7BU32_9BACT|nr:hypothetical protein [Occallatibacter riparius]UWZ85250.1 hypothetical protein MOP44_04740 [Occallatibacter riparius]
MTEFTVNGTGATPNGGVTATITAPDTTKTSAHTTADGKGNFSFGPFTEPAAGIYSEVDVDDQSGNSTVAFSWTISSTSVPAVTALSPTTMNPDNTTHQLTIYGSNFAAGNVVQVNYTGSGGWVDARGNPPSISPPSQMTIGINPGSSADTIYVRVCQSATQETASTCSSGTQSISVTAAAPSVSSISPTSMAADNTTHQLTIYGSNFAAGNVVQVNYTGSGGWVDARGNPPSISPPSQMTIGINPGSSADTIYVRVCQSATQETASTCSSGTQSISVTAAAPSVSSISPTSMAADNTTHQLTIYGSNFAAGNVVQVNYTGSGGWVDARGNPPSISPPSQMTIGINPGSSADTIYVRVCQSATQETASTCSSGTQSISVN